MGAIAGAKYGPAVISDYVFDEVVTVTFVRTKSLLKARLVGEAMLKSFRMMRVNEAVLHGEWRRFRNKKGTRFSFTDATTAELMQLTALGTLLPSIGFSTIQTNSWFWGPRIQKSKNLMGN